MLHRLPQIRVPVDLRRLFPQAEFVDCGGVENANGFEVFDATDNSRAILPGMLFAAVPGFSLDGTDFVEQALSCGATSLLVAKQLPNANVPQCVVPNVRESYARLCQAIAGEPSKQLSLVGVTGTNGKTTVTWLLRSIVRAAGLQSGVLGTVEYHDGKIRSEAALTTPDSKTLADWLSAMVWHNTTHAAMELSSHSLDQDRASGVELAAAVITNITQDHLDYHGSIEQYKASKATITSLLRDGGSLVVNGDDDHCRSIGESANAIRFGFGEDCEVTATVTSQSLTGSQFVLRCGNESAEVSTRLLGRHNVANCLAAAAAARALEIPFAAICEGVAALDAVPGRLEPIQLGQPFHVFVDYAHTPDALRRCLLTLRELTPGRLHCVFGAGGDRDATKRPLMGRAAAVADEITITNDNPRSEDPLVIARSLLAGVNAAGANATVELDRKAAIELAIASAKPGDSVLIAGKGHEAMQLVGPQRIPFRDAGVVRDILSSLGHSFYSHVA